MPLIRDQDLPPLVVLTTIPVADTALQSVAHPILEFTNDADMTKLPPERLKGDISARPWAIVNSGRSLPLLDTPANKAESGGMKCFGVFELGTCGLKVNRPLPSLSEAPPRNTGAPVGITTGVRCIPGVTLCALEDVGEEQAEMRNASATGTTPIALALRGAPIRACIAAVYFASTEKLGLGHSSSSPQSVLGVPADCIGDI